MPIPRSARAAATYDNGIISRGKATREIRYLCVTIPAVAVLTDVEKNVQGIRPEKMNRAYGKSSPLRPISLEKIRVYVIISTKDGRTAQVQPSSDCLYRTLRRNRVISRNKLLWLQSSVRPADKIWTKDRVGRMTLTDLSPAAVGASVIAGPSAIGHCFQIPACPPEFAVARLPRHLG